MITINYIMKPIHDVILLLSTYNVISDYMLCFLIILYLIKCALESFQKYN